MTPKQKEEMYQSIEQHGINLLEIFPFSREKNPVKLCKKLRRYENKAAILAVGYCNGEEPADVEQRLETIKTSVINLLGTPAESTVFLNLDPRGYTLKLTSEFCKNRTIFRDWGGYGILAPDFTPNK